MNLSSLRLVAKANDDGIGRDISYDKTAQLKSVCERI
jgi:hypothetical protein